MFCCNICCKEFKTNWQLQRHFSSKRPCKKAPQETSISPQETSISPQETSISPQETSFFPQETSLKCEYCCQQFSRIDNLKRHECKERNCYIRNLEIKLKMDVNIDIHSKTCRFCNKEFSQKCNCTRHSIICKKKKEYLSMLENKLKEQYQNMKGQTINSNNSNNNNTNCNNVTNNIINVNSLGNENMKYITTKMLKQLWSNVKSNEEGVAKTIKMIHASKDHPENHNIIYTNMRSNVALVKIDNEFEYKNINEIFKDVSVNTLDAIILSTEYDDLSKFIKKKYEEVCEDEEMNREASIQAKTELYNSYKKGDIKKP